MEAGTEARTEAETEAGTEAGTEARTLSISGVYRIHDVLPVGYCKTSIDVKLIQSNAKPPMGVCSVFKGLDLCNLTA